MAEDDGEPIAIPLTMKIISRFDATAADWDNNPVRVDLARSVGAKIAQSVPPEPHWHVLDYGAGTGLLTLCLQPLVSSILAVDSSVGMLETLSHKLTSAGLTNVSVCRWDLESQLLQQSGFDLVVSSMTLHHLRDVPLVFNRLVDVLKPGGWLAVADLDVEDGSFHGASKDVFHCGFDRQRITEWLIAAGLQGVSIGDAHTITKPDSTGQLRSYQVFLATGQKRVG